MSKLYAVTIQIEGPIDPTEAVPKPRKLAAFDTFEEAVLFENQLELRYSAEAVGEGRALEQMTSPADFQAGD